MPNTVDAKQTTLGDLIAERMHILVPPYQRSYAWEADDVEDFVSDIQLLYERKLSANENGLGDENINHFFGGLVLVEHPSEANLKGRAYELVDGQQRLATFVLTIAKLIDAFKKLSKQAEKAKDSLTASTSSFYSQQTADDFLYYKRMEGQKTVQSPRLRMSSVDQKFYEELLSNNNSSLGKDAPASHKRLARASRILTQKLVGKITSNTSNPPSEILKRLRTLLECLTERVWVVKIVSTQRLEAYSLFSTLNDRGRALNEGDLLRVRSLQLLAPYDDLQKEIETHWDHILSEAHADVQNFLRSYYPSYAGIRAPKHDLFGKFSQFFFPFQGDSVNDNSDAEKIRDTVAKLSAESDRFIEIAEGQWPYSQPEVSEWDRTRLDLLVRALRNTLAIPLLLAARASISESEFADLVHILDLFTFRFINTDKLHVGDAAEIYYKNAKLIRTSPHSFDLNTFKNQLRGLFDAEEGETEIFRTKLTNLRIDKGPQERRNILYLLTTLESYYEWWHEKAEFPAVPIKDHVYDINNQISVDFISSLIQDESKESEALKQSIGNLAILEQSPIIENKHKIELYKNSEVKLTNSLAVEKSFSNSFLLERRNMLVDMAVAVFSLKTSGNANSTGDS